MIPIAKDRCVLDITLLLKALILIVKKLVMIFLKIETAAALSTFKSKTGQLDSNNYFDKNIDKDLLIFTD